MTGVFYILPTWVGFVLVLNIIQYVRVSNPSLQQIFDLEKKQCFLHYTQLNAIQADLWGSDHLVASCSYEFILTLK